MQINLTLTINLEPTEITPLVAALLGRFQQSLSQAPQTAPNAFLGINLPATDSTPVLAPVAPATEAAEATPDEPESAESIIGTALAAQGLAPLEDWRPVAYTQPAPKAAQPKPAPAKRGAIQPGETEKPKRIYPARLPFGDLDPLVRSEMKRLSMDRRIPGHKLWDEERDKRLPTMSGVIQRYGVGTLADLAEKLGMLPPLSASKGGA